MKKDESKAKKEKFLQLRVIEGKSFDSIAKEIGVSKKTLINWSVELKEEIEELTADCKQKMYEELELSAIEKERYKLELYKKLRDNILNCDLATLPIDKQYILLKKLEEDLDRWSPQYKSDKIEKTSSFDELEELLGKTENIRVTA